MIESEKWPEEMTKAELLREVLLGRRVMYALGWNAWPDEKWIRGKEAEQRKMQEEYDAENAKDPQ